MINLPEWTKLTALATVNMPLRKDRKKAKFRVWDKVSVRSTLISGGTWIPF